MRHRGQRLAQTIAGFLSAAAAACPAAAQWSVVPLQPEGFMWSKVYAVTPTHQYGQGLLESVGTTQAMVWAGSAAGWSSLSPTSTTSAAVYGVSGNQQVGVVNGHAGLWSGTPGSFVDLNAPGWYASSAAGTNGQDQAGAFWTTQLGPSHAVLWHGSAGSWVDLNPVGAYDSGAGPMAAGQQGGSVEFNGPNGITPPRAGLWSGTAASFVNLHPGPDFLYSYLYGMAPASRSAPRRVPVRLITPRCGAAPPRATPT